MTDDKPAKPAPNQTTDPVLANGGTIPQSVESFDPEFIETDKKALPDEAEIEAAEEAPRAPFADIDEKREPKG